MAKSAILQIRILSDSKQAKADFDKTASGLEKFEARLDKLTPAATAIVGGLTALGTAAYNSASELQQSSGAVASVFGAYADEVHQYAKTAATDVGLAQSQYQQMAAVLGSQLSNMGIPMEAVAGQTNELITLGADLAATFGGTTADAVDALSSLMRGERDPIERFGVSIKQADINAQLAAMGLDGLSGEAARAAETQATLALLTEQTAAAQGQFARETDTAAGATQIATAQFEDAKAMLGEVLLPVVTAVMTALGELAEWVKENQTAALVLTGVVGGLAAGVLAANAAIKIYKGTQAIITAATKAWTVAQRALNLVLRMNPIGLVITAITALVAGIVYAYNNSETFRKIVNKLWSAIKSGISTVVSGMKKVGEWISYAGSVVRNILAVAFDYVWSRWNSLYSALKNGFTYVVDLIRWARDWLSNLFSFRMPGWMQSITGWFGRSAVIAPEVTMQAARTTTASDARAAALAGLTAPAMFAPSASGRLGLGGTGGGPIVNLTVNGALDPEAVARQIEGILTTYNRRRGRAVFGMA